MTRWDAIFGLAALLILWACVAACCSSCSSAGAESDCALVRTAVNARFMACNIGGKFDLACDQVDYESGGVEPCLAALRAAPCDEVETVYRQSCNLFGYWSIL